ncbi:MAG: hypothetical protein HFI63_01615 [Lachnospiraceae bacterium]|nr:hypothetical protein [Lachnospiraceae bacterium]
MRQKRRLLGLLLVICLAIGLTPTTAFAVRRTSRSSRTSSASSTSVDGAIQLVNTGNPNGGIRGYDEKDGQGYHNIYYGEWQNQFDAKKEPLKWRVLDTEGNNGNTDCLFVLSEILLGTGNDGGLSFDDTRIPNSNQWQGSDAQNWCKDFAGESGADTKVDDAFRPEELSAILNTTKDDTVYTSIDSQAYAASSGILNGDRVFFLSAQEAENKRYGFIDAEAGAGLYGTEKKQWWLRSACEPPSLQAGVFDPGGSQMTHGNVVSAVLPARPAFNLKMEDVLFTSAADGKSSGTVGENALKKVSTDTPSEWKLTLKDRNRNGFSAAPVSKSGTDVKAGESMKFTYSGAKTEAGLGTGSGPDREYVSVMLVEKDSQKVLYYGRIVNCQDAVSENGTIDVKIPADIKEGDYTLMLFSEQYNGEKRTDYASNLVPVDITVLDTTAPKLTEKGARRESVTKGFVKFVSDEAGEYYYEIVEAGSASPQINTSGAGEPCDTTEQTITFDHLSEGAKDVYLVVKDAAGNVSAPLKIELPAGTAPVYSISASPESLDFGRVMEGYTQPTARTVAIENTGDQKITLAASVSAKADSNFAIGPLSEASLAPGATATFTVRPKADLPVGKYEETITLSISGRKETADVSVSFEVNEDTPGKYTITATAGEGGSITPGSATVDEGGSTTFAISPQSGYEIDTVMVDGTEDVTSRLSEQKEYTFTDVRKDHTIEVTFKAIEEKPAPSTYKVQVSASPEAGGVVTGGGDYPDGSKVLVTATANNGYRFVRWTERDSELSTSASYEFPIASDRNLVAVFEAEAPTPAVHHVTVDSSYATQPGTGDYSVGATVTIQAGTRENYRFDGWLTNDEITFADVKNATTTFVMPNKDVTVAAKWMYVSPSGTTGGTNNGTNTGSHTTTGTGSGGNSTGSDGKGGVYTGDDTPAALWISVLCTSLGILIVVSVLEWRSRRLYSESEKLWNGLTEKEFGYQKRKSNIR